MGLPPGTTGINSYVVCQGNATFPGICTYAPNKGAAAPGDLTAFNGKVSNGTWRFCVGDSGGGDVGSVDQVTLTISK